MEFLTKNHINTTTQISIQSNTSLISYIFGRDNAFSYYTDGFNNDATTASITITFDETTPVSRIALKETNLKSFSIFYNGSTANTFGLTGGATTVSSFTNNSETSLYLKCATTMVSSVTIDMKTTQIANGEKALGMMLLSDLYLQLTHIPDAKGYKPMLKAKQVMHTMSDGGTRIHTLRKKYNVSLSLDYLSQTLRDSLRTVYDLAEPFYFCPWGTSTSWDGILFESVWTGDWDFYEYSDNASVSGFSGTVRLKETPS